MLPIFLFVLASANAKMEFAPVSVLGSNEEMSVLEMSCSGEKPFANISCDFVQKSIRIDGEDNGGDLKDFSDKDIKDFKAKTCKTLEKIDAMKDFQLTARAALELQIAPLEKACKCLSEKFSKECVKNFIIETDALKKRTCKVVTNKFSVDFKRISENKWMNTPEPKGLCNLVNATTLESDGKYKWTFLQTRISSDKGPLCPFQELKTAKYSNWFGKAFKPNCDLIDLGSIF